MSYENSEIIIIGDELFELYEGSDARPDIGVLRRPEPTDPREAREFPPDEESFIVLSRNDSREIVSSVERRARKN